MLDNNCFFRFMILDMDLVFDIVEKRLRGKGVSCIKGEIAVERKRWKQGEMKKILNNKWGCSE